MVPSSTLKQQILPGVARAITPNCCLFNGRSLLFEDPRLTRDDPVRFFPALHACLLSPLRPSVTPLFFVLLLALFTQPSPIFPPLSFCPYPLPFSPPYFLRILTESTARTGRHSWLFSSVSILISRARNSRTLRSLGVLKRMPRTSRQRDRRTSDTAVAALEIGSAVDSFFLSYGAFISAAMKKTRLCVFLRTLN